MEGALGTSFGEVRVHTDTEADVLNRSVSAVAFTTGSDIFFSQGSFEPTSAEGRQLLAHELTHVVQQRGVSGSGPLTVGPAGDSHEQEADATSAAAAAVLESGPPAIDGRAAAEQTWPVVDARRSSQERADGNAAVDGLLRQYSLQRSAVQRYESYEHANQGDHAPGSRTATVGEHDDDLHGRTQGVQLTSGEINALADLYGSPDDLFKASPDEVTRVLKVLHKQQQDPKSVQESEWDDATGGRYTKLNLRNAPHFGPSNPDLIKPPSGTTHSGDNRTMFTRYYNEAIVNALEAFHHLGLPSAEHTRRYLDRATIAAGFAEHYIMDAFSAGHLFNKDDFVALLQQNLKPEKGEDLPGAKVEELLGPVAHGVLADSRSKELLSHYEPMDRPPIDKLGGVPMPWRPNFNYEYAFEGLLEGLYKDSDGRQAVYSALAKVVHDHLITNIDAGSGKLGVEVVNDVRPPWVLSGDKTLASSEETRQMIDRAIGLFRQLMQPYFAGTVPPGTGGGYAPGSEQVIAYFPRPTHDSITTITELVNKFSDPKDHKVDMINGLVEFLIKELPSFLHALMLRGKIRRA
jgi:hypothetical protein